VYGSSGFRGGYYGSGYRNGYYRYSYPRYSYGFGYYPGFYSGFGFGYGSAFGYGAYGYADPYYYDGYYPSGGYASAPAYYQESQPSPPVVINEYYTPRSAAQPRVRDYSNGGYGVEPAPRPAATTPAKKPDYWLLAFPNGTIVLAVTYWTDQDFLHYVTRNKEPKQVPLSALDHDLTEQLNRERGLEFRIPR